MCFLESNGSRKKVPCFLFFWGEMSEYIYIYNLIIIIIYVIHNIYIYLNSVYTYTLLYIHVSMYIHIFIYIHRHVHTYLDYICPFFLHGSLSLQLPPWLFQSFSAWMVNHRDLWDLCLAVLEHMACQRWVPDEVSGVDGIWDWGWAGNDSPGEW